MALCPTAEDLSDYEKLRQRNISRNREVMRALGLDEHDFALHAVHSGGRGKNSQNGGRAESKQQAGGARKRVRDVAGDDGGDGTAQTPADVPRRRSARLKGVAAAPVGFTEEAAGDKGSGEGVLGRGRREAPLRASEDAHRAAEAEHLRWAGRQKRASVVGTASYQHTLHRVRTMDEAALARRIKAIERAKGQVGISRTGAAGDAHCSIMQFCALTKHVLFELCA